MSAFAVAQLRQIPDFAKRGSMSHVEDAVVEVDGTRMRLAAGAQIRNQENLIIVPISLPRGALVKFTVDAAGQIQRAWILTPAETAVPDRPQE